MFRVRQKLPPALVALAVLCAAPAVRASMMHEPNNTPSTAFMLPSGQLVVSDELDGASGRADTVLGHYDPTFSTLFAINDNAPGVGNGFGSQLLDVPLHTNGSAYFSVTGAPDYGFVGTGAHSQLGQYSVTYEIYNSMDVKIDEVIEFEAVTPGPVDYTWLNPDPSRAGGGYTVDVTVNNVIGPGSGDSLDFFLFTGLQPNMPFMARFVDVDFSGIIGVYDLSNNRGDTGAMVSGFADAFGRVKLGVSAAEDVDFIGQHSSVGTYTLEVIPVPEPASVWLLAAGGALLGLLGWCRRDRIGKPDCVRAR